jgi:hypothetical protein
MFKKALIEEYGKNKFSHESKLVVDELKKRNIPYQTFTFKKVRRRQLPLDIETFVVGDIDCTYGVLKQLGIPISGNNNYPESLKHLFYRKIWRSTLGEIESRFHYNDYCGNYSPVFVKPSKREKCFNGFVAETEADFYSIRVSKKEPVFCSEIVKWLSEYRVYVVNSQILSVDFYQGNKNIKLDIDIILKAIKTLDIHNESYAGYAIDFGVLSSGETALIELNDGYSVGAYKIGMKNYTNMLIARWEELMSFGT